MGYQGARHVSFEFVQMMAFMAIFGVNPIVSLMLDLKVVSVPEMLFGLIILCNACHAQIKFYAYV